MTSMEIPWLTWLEAGVGGEETEIRVSGETLLCRTSLTVTTYRLSVWRVSWTVVTLVTVLSIVIMVKTLGPVASRCGVKLSSGVMVDTLEQGGPEAA